MGLLCSHDSFYECFFCVACFDLINCMLVRYNFTDGQTEKIYAMRQLLITSNDVDSDSIDETTSSTK